MALVKPMNLSTHTASTTSTTSRAKRLRGGTQPLPLTRDDVVSAALPLLAQFGVADLTIRSVADTLGVSSPAIYHHIAGRDDLIDRLCERVADGVDLSVNPDVPWDDAIVTLLSNMDRAFARYPGVASRVLLSRRRSPAADRITSTVHQLVLRSGCSARRAHELVASLQFLFAGWLLGSPGPTAHEPATAELLARSIRWLLRGFEDGQPEDHVPAELRQTPHQPFEGPSCATI
jgi:TetR/AcrR family transcriptional regulator, tetracycline repressor protein